MHIHCLRFSLIPYRLLSSLFLFCSLPSSTFLLCVPSARCAHCLSLSLAFSPFPPALRRCISSADESGGSETEYGIAEGGRPIERARGMQSERSRCCHVTERARARGQERTRQRMDDNFSEPMSWYDLLLILLPFLFLPPVLSLLAAYPTLLIRVYAVFAGSSSLASRASAYVHSSRANANESHLPSVFANVYEGREKNVPSLSAMSFLSGIRGILTRTISRARAMCKKRIAY